MGLIKALYKIQIPLSPIEKGERGIFIKDTETQRLKVTEKQNLQINKSTVVCCSQSPFSLGEGPGMGLVI
jgi:hypothetical protein